VGLPKALLPVGGRPLLDYWVSSFARNGIASVHVVCNDQHYAHFRRWAESRSFPLDHLFNDGSSSNEERKGAIGALHLVMKVIIFLLLVAAAAVVVVVVVVMLMALQERNIRENVLVVAADTLFEKDFKLEALLDRFSSLVDGATLITYYELRDHQEVTKRGVIEIDEKSSKVSRRGQPPLNHNNHVSGFCEAGDQVSRKAQTRGDRILQGVSCSLHLQQSRDSADPSVCR